MATIPEKGGVLEHQNIPAGKPTRHIDRRWVLLATLLCFLLPLFYYSQQQQKTPQRTAVSKRDEPTILKCDRSEMEIPYCLKCVEPCLLECGGSHTVIPYCHDFGPNGPRKFLGEDEKPFLVDLAQDDIVQAESEGGKMSWAAKTKFEWNKIPELSKSQRMALCWGRKSWDNMSMTYQCAEIKLR